MAQGARTKIFGKTPKQIDTLIDTIFTVQCNGIQINIMDITKVFKVGHAAWAVAGNPTDVDKAIVDFVQTIRKN